MARAIPDVPIDGEQYASLGLAGLPQVLEYDAPTGGYKLVVSTEAGVAINISGTVEVTGGQLTLVGGAAYGEDTPHASGNTGTFVMGVRQDSAQSQVDAEGDYAAFLLDSFGQLHTTYSGSYVANFTAPASLGATIPTPTTTQVGALLYGFDVTDSAVWERLDSSTDADDGVAAATDGILKISSRLMGLDGTTSGSGRWDRLRQEGVTGSFALRTSLYAQQGAGAVNPNAPGNYALRVDPQGRLETVANVSGTVSIDELPAAGGVGDNFSAPTSTSLYALGLGFDRVNNFWQRMSVDADTFALRVTVTGTVQTQLETGDIEIGAVEIKNADTELRAQVATLGDAFATPTGSLSAGAFNMIYDIVGDNWDRDPARLNTDAMTAGVFPQRTSFNMFYDYDLGSYQRLFGSDPDADSEPGDVLGGNMQRGINVRAVQYGLNSASTFDRIRGDKERGLYVSMISGSFPGQDGATLLGDAVANPYAGLVGAMGMGYDPVAATWRRLRVDPGTFAQLVAITGTASVDTELAAAIAAADGMANPTVPQVLSNLMGYNGATWDRLYMGISGSLAVDLVSQLNAVNDEVTAYVTGTVMADFVTGSVVGLGGITKVIRREVVNISGSGGEFELIAANGVNRLKVTSMMLIVDADTNVHFQSGWTGTAVTGPMSLPADGDGFFLNTPSTPDQFHFESEPGENLVIDQSAAAAIGGWIQYYAEA